MFESVVFLPGRSWAHTASTEPYRGWSSATARRDSVSSSTSESSLISSHNKLQLNFYVWIRFSFPLFSFTGVKIIGGYRELTGEEFGIYIKRVIVGGLAALDGGSFSGFSVVVGRYTAVIILTHLSLCSRSA